MVIDITSHLLKTKSRDLPERMAHQFQLEEKLECLSVTDPSGGPRELGTPRSLLLLFFFNAMQFGGKMFKILGWYPNFGVGTITSAKSWIPAGVCSYLTLWGSFVDLSVGFHHTQILADRAFQVSWLVTRTGWTRFWKWREKTLKSDNHTGRTT